MSLVDKIIIYSLIGLNTVAIFYKSSLQNHYQVGGLVKIVKTNSSLKGCVGELHAKNLDTRSEELFLTNILCPQKIIFYDKILNVTSEDIERV